MTSEMLNDILEKHNMYLRHDPNGEKANLRGANFIRADLRGANLCKANLCKADLFWADLRGANLCEADLFGADLRGADFYGADLRGADLRGANLSGADLGEANLYGAKLSGANLRGADLRGANFCIADLRGANLREADLRGANLYGANLIGAKNVPFIPMVCPDSGGYTAYKKARDYIVVLEIMSDALRSSATTRKCRASKAKVLRIEKLDGSICEDVKECISNYDKNFIYKVGEIVEVKNFDLDRWKECSTGIHHFINRQEAVEYRP